MLPDDEIALIKWILEGERIYIDCCSIVAIPNKTGVAVINLAMASGDGKRYVVPIPMDIAAALGDALLRAVDAADAGLVSLPE